MSDPTSETGLGVSGAMAFLEREDSEDSGRQYEDPSRYVTLALPSSQCFAVPLESEVVRRLNGDQAIAYELEAVIPIEAERLQVSLKYAKPKCLVLAVDIDECAEQIDLLKERGAEPLWISPMIFLALQNFAEQSWLENDMVVVWEGDGGVDIVQIGKRLPVRWRWLPHDFQQVAEVVRGLEIEAPNLKVCVAGDEQFLEEFCDVSPGVANTRCAKQQDCAMQTAKTISLGAKSPWFNFRTGNLAPDDSYAPVRDSLSALKLCSLVLMAAWIVVVFIRTQSLASITDESIELQETTYQEIFPRTPIPVGIHARLRSEHARLASTRGMGASRVPTVGSVLPVLHAFLSSLPIPINYEFDGCEFDARLLVSARGKTKTFEDAQSVADALIKAGFGVPPISRIQTSSGVILRFENAAWTSASERGR